MMMAAFSRITALLMMMSFLVAVSSFQPSRNRLPYRHTALNMGFMDALNKAMANDASLPPPVNPGLRYQSYYHILVLFMKVILINKCHGDAFNC